ncbi:MAG: ABC transporter ATP-binding protein [Bryobacteraceae bacterium]|nr:ABC transporter ATP-binding protein [Bryobacteraceae bacterium]
MSPSQPSFWRGWRRRLSALHHIPPVLKMVWQSGPGLVLGGLVFRVLAALVPLAMLWVSKLIIDLVAGAQAGQGIPPRVWWLLGAEFGLAACGHIFSRLVDYFDSLLADEFTRHISVQVMEHANRLDLATLEDPAFYDTLERARVQATDRLGMLNAIGRIFQQVVTLTSLAVGVFLFSPWLLLILVAATVPAFLGESHFAFLGYSLAYGQTPRRRELDYLRTLGASRESAKELRIFGLGPWLVSRYREVTDSIIRENRALVGRRLRAGSALAILGSIGYYACYAVVVVEAVQGRISVGDLTFLAGAIAGASANIASLFSTFSSIADQALFLTDLVVFMNVRPRIVSKPDALPAPRPIRDGFAFDQVSFHYPGSSRLVLDDLSFRLEPDTRVALVGENGQGKTTIVKLLARLYEPTAGRILLDGVDLREYSVEDLGREIGVIFQDFMRYEMCARENIGVGRIDKVSDAERVRHAARKSMADEVLTRLPGGLDQMLGRRFEGGVDLSGGEWQKFALARAYMRDAQVLILDEPTAALDARSEYEVFLRFSELTHGKMAILISHRFSTVRMADRIMVLEQGRVREEGTHHQLLSRGGLYAGMFELQAAGYR